jgi:geranylgeranyl pyrophosphate synthase
MTVPARRPFTSAPERLLAEALSSEALGTLAPAGVPAELWADALARPVSELLSRPGKGFRGRLTSLAFRLAGGDQEPAALGAMLELIHAGSMIVDDIEDDSPVRRGGPSLHRLFGVPLALNAGNWLYFFPLELAGRLGLPADAELALRRRMTRTMLDCHHGQALDLGAQVGEVPRAKLADVALAISTLKTGRLMGLAAAAGALVAGGPPAIVEGLARFGEALGLGLQMLDDLGNLSGEAAPGKRFEDLRRGRVTWAWAWAAELLEERSFRALERQGRQVARGEGDAEALAAGLRRTVNAEGRLRAHWSLERALGEVRAVFGPSPLVQALAGELERLESSYG